VYQYFMRRIYFAQFTSHFREKETEVLKEQIDKLNKAITREEEKAKDLEIKARCAKKT
jgi:hypothetical protein